MLLPHEVFVHGALQHVEQGGEVSVHVQYDDGVEVESQLFPGDDFQQFLQCAASSRQGDDGIAQAGHLLFAAVHVVHFDQFRQSAVVPALLHHETGNDAGHLTACCQHGVGGGTHQADASCAVYQADMPFGKQGAQLAGGVEIDGVDLGA